MVGMTHTEQLERIEGIVPACITPFTEDHSINPDMVEPLVDHFANAGVGGLFVNGSSAEFLTLTDDERKIMAEAYKQAADRHDLPVIVHVGARSLESAVELAGHAESIGVDAIATLPPVERENSTIDNDFAWYQAVGAASNLPLITYLRSDMGNGDIGPKEFLTRATGIPTLAGIKYGAPNMHIPQGIKQLRPGLKILTGPDELLLPGLIMDSDGAIGTTYNAFPNHAVDIYQSFQEGDMPRARKLQRELGAVIHELIDEGVVLAGTKAIMREQGLAVGQCRPSETYGMAQAAHTEKKFTDRVTSRQVDGLMRIVRKYGMN